MQRLGHAQFLHGRDLEVSLVPEFEEFLFGEKTQSASRFLALESASLWDFEPIFVNSQALDF